MNISSYRGRFAPSPTGPLHLGSLYTAVASYCQARAKKGLWLVRMDDIDSTRCRPQYATEILNTLQQYGLHWDEPILYQSSRTEAYEHALNGLIKNDIAYVCCCSRKQLEERLSGSNKHLYDGYCLLHLPTEDRLSIRLKVNSAKITFTDQVQGNIKQLLEHETGDFIIRRKDQIFSYHLATVIDDAEQKISEVLRGNDLLDSTARQIYLQQLLTLNTPKYAHIPVIVNDQGAKLSKQTFATSVQNLPTERTLINIMKLLQLNPPNYLESCDKNEILSWAVKHWRLTNLTALSSLHVTTDNNE